MHQSMHQSTEVKLNRQGMEMINEEVGESRVLSQSSRDRADKNIKGSKSPINSSDF